MQSLSSTNAQSWLVWFLKGLLLVGSLVLLGRLIELQVIKGNYFHALAEENRIRRVPITASRGKILARHGQVLADSIEVRKWLEFSPTEGFTKKEVQENTPAEETIVESRRVYPIAESFAHASGYLGQVSPEEVGKVDAACIEKGDLASDAWVGRGGLEESYSCLLRGVDGEELVEVDTMGRKIRTLGTKLPISGSNLQTTIDYELQKKVAEVMRNQENLGAVIISDGKGEILSFYSHPSFNPNESISKYLDDPAIPLFNRVIGGVYHPGSIFKIVTSAAALEDKKIPYNFNYDDPGVIRINEFSYATWYFTQYGRTEGTIDLPRALARSTDTFFYKLGEFVGVESLASWATKFGLGAKAEIDVPGEVSGLVPTPEWKKRVKNENWFLGNTYHMSIGQGDLTTTVLEANIMTSVIASNGYLCKPHLKKTDAEDCKKLPIANETIAQIKNGLIGACATGGTGYPFFDFEPKVACKTGTAETEEEDKTHAWFTVMAPADNPKIVVTVLLEKAGEGSSVAAPIAREILDFWNLHVNP